MPYWAKTLSTSSPYPSSRRGHTTISRQRTSPVRNRATISLAAHSTSCRGVAAWARVTGHASVQGVGRGPYRCPSIQARAGWLGWGRWRLCSSTPALPRRARRLSREAARRAGSKMPSGSLSGSHTRATVTWAWFMSCSSTCSSWGVKSVKPNTAISLPRAHPVSVSCWASTSRRLRGSAAP